MSALTFNPDQHGLAVWISVLKCRCELETVRRNNSIITLRSHDQCGRVINSFPHVVEG